MSTEEWEPADPPERGRTWNADRIARGSGGADARAAAGRRRLSFAAVATAVLFAVAGAALGLWWWQFWYEADATTGSARTFYAPGFVLRVIATLVYLGALWRWLTRRQ